MKANKKTSNNDPKQFAALDIGSNSFHLIIARLVEGQLQPIFKFKQPVQLGEGLSNRHLSDAALYRGVEALRQCAVRLEGFHRDTVKVVATHTLRKAKNRKRFLAEAAKVLPFPIEIISGREEARLIFRGVAETSSESTGSQLVIDIGGGSTEFAIGKNRQPKFLSSRSIGSLAFSKEFFSSGKITPKRFDKAVVSARQHVEPIANYLAEHQVESVFGTSGTIKAIYQWIVKRDGEQPLGINYSQLQGCRTDLIAAESLKKLNKEWVSPERRESIAGGVAVLLGIFEELGIERLVPHDSALREGVLYELAGEVLLHQDVRERTINSLAQRYSVDSAQAQRVLSTVQQIWGSVAENWGLTGQDLEVLLEGAAKLHEVGLSISASGVQKHSGYILAHAYMPGFNAEEQRFLSTIVRYFRKKIQTAEFPDLILFSQNQLIKMLIIMRLGVILNSDRQNSSSLDKAVIEDGALKLQLKGSAKEDSVLTMQLESEANVMQKLGYELLVC
ncbi:MULTISPECIES: exopolyphosphatase [unclassified Idiomarina]|uniref:Ppx/GppA phosphatase family protein n=1 Tax=unclassified Idiomarina TaxID=2614829 RepID=UPI000C11C9A7|nr:MULTISPECIES: exopolyphosphatase [unclassified Idiomarina]MBL4857022.1 exopolyphosphatase [Idiomarina sp.]PHQ92074.1 MAG: exopolyphosphatase [Idiomarina sp.]|tara:strand:+ start:3099 stop:4610 length:1512 start_codon:yes stop_codon:yes gene_type:complete